jgi:hypothetical protein
MSLPRRFEVESSGNAHGESRKARSLKRSSRLSRSKRFELFELLERLELFAGRLSFASNRNNKARPLNPTEA